MGAEKVLSVAQQRKRTERCKDCRGWGYIPGHTPMKICDCVVRTEHRRPAPPAGTKLIDSRQGAAVTRADRERRGL